jgi:hypothetical protein
MTESIGNTWWKFKWAVENSSDSLACRPFVTPRHGRVEPAPATRTRPASFDYPANLKSWTTPGQLSMQKGVSWGRRNLDFSEENMLWVSSIFLFFSLFFCYCYFNSIHCGLVWEQGCLLFDARWRQSKAIFDRFSAVKSTSFSYFYFSYF